MWSNTFDQRTVPKFPQEWFSEEKKKYSWELRRGKLLGFIRERKTFLTAAITIQSLHEVILTVNMPSARY